VAVLSNDGDFDPRNHKSFLIAGYEMESLADIPESKVHIYVGLMGEYQDLELEELGNHCKRWLAACTGVDGARARLAADVAKRDEALRMVEAENRANNAQAAADNGPAM
jgi:hypothetical protein